MAIYRHFADHHWEFADPAGLGFVESTDNLPIFSGNLPILAGVFDGTTTENRPTKSPNRPSRLSESERRIVR